jgi:gamma-glutamylaminecyclotransferase
MTDLVFVFGTLKDGFPNFAVNAGRRVPGSFRTVEARPMYLVGERCVPWLVDAAGEGHRVAGELYEVDDATLVAMDRLEGIGRPDGYVRLRLDIEPLDAPAGAMRAWAYLKPVAQLTADLVRIGPLAEYTLEDALRYRKRTMADALHLSTVTAVAAPDGFAAWPLARLTGGSMARFELGAGRVSRAVRHRAVEEIWFVLSGAGEMWRRQGEWEEIIAIEPGLCVTLPVGTSFQFRAGTNAPIVAIAATMPPWPGDDEATIADGHWQPSS